MRRRRSRKSRQEISPAKTALAIGELDREHLAAAIPIDAGRNWHRLPDNHTEPVKLLCLKAVLLIGLGNSPSATASPARLKAMPGFALLYDVIPSKNREFPAPPRYSRNRPAGPLPGTGSSGSSETRRWREPYSNHRSHLGRDGDGREPEPAIA